MAKYRKKPVVIEAEQWKGFQDVPEAQVLPYTSDTDRRCTQCHGNLHEHGYIKTLEGGHIVCPYDWIIKGVKGEFYPCKPDIFEQTYEKVE